MKIVLSGVETNNKGAELMLYAILQEVERKWPDAEVYVSPWAVSQGLDYVKTSLKLHYWPISRMMKATHINGVLTRLKLPTVIDTKAVKADYFIDGSGFLFSDQCQLWGQTPERWEKLLKYQYQHGAKIVFLPQAFGPIEMDITKKAISSIGKYASIVMPRENQSYRYLKESGLIDMKKVQMFTDFTSTVTGQFPSQHAHLKDGICIIPNINMIAQGVMAYQDYINLLAAIIKEGKASGKPVYLLNHEGKDDEKLAYECRESVNGSIEVVTGLNAIEVKGLIESASLVITSRFHGLASALNSCVPTLSTSWSHKYAELYKDYGLDGFLLPLDNVEKALDDVRKLLDEQENTRIRQQLKSVQPKIREEARKMWDLVWNL